MGVAARRCRFGASQSPQGDRPLESLSSELIEFGEWCARVLFATADQESVGRCGYYTYLEDWGIMGGDFFKQVKRSGGVVAGRDDAAWWLRVKGDQCMIEKMRGGRSFLLWG